MLSNVREASLTLLYKQSFPHQPLPLFFLSFEVNKTKKTKQKKPLQLTTCKL